MYNSAISSTVRATDVCYSYRRDERAKGGCKFIINVSLKKLLSKLISKKVLAVQPFVVQLLQMLFSRDTVYLNVPKWVHNLYL